MRLCRAVLVIPFLTFAGAPDYALAGDPIVENYGNYRNITVRRHNDIEGAEALFDDYRRQWFKEGYSGVRVGKWAGEDQRDMPRCSSADGQKLSVNTRINCGSNHIFRLNVTGIAASDSDTASIDETGALAYLGYEYLFSNDAFLGLGATYAVSDIDSSLNGSTLDSEVSEFGAHFVGGYRFPREIGVAWNISLTRSTDDLTRNGSITSSVDMTGVMISGVIFQNWYFSQSTYLSYGLDYTFLGLFGPGTVTDSSGAVQDTGINNGRGDFTGSLLLVHELDRAEVFARLGSTAEVILATDRWLDATADVGGSLNLSDNIALTGTVGGTYRMGNYLSGRGSVRLVGKF
ncbi:hypothetical protein [Roseibium sp. MMSF_3544]|uniref:hypothetical protein n=1 Tax=unclassified Roseibium TaxID=2629323 RepID=UPI00273E3EB8|nr:hypothetical protein [Roseibium sp. MMSF_3544]